MNSLARVLATVNFQDTDRPPVIPQILGHAAVVNNVPLNEYLQNGETLATCQLAAQKYYECDALFVFMDACVESEALGSTVRYGIAHYPAVQNFALTGDMDFNSLQIPDPQRSGRLPELLKAASIIREQVADTIPVVGCVLGPMSLACQLLPMEETLLLAIEETDRFLTLLDFCTDVAITCGLAQIRAGVHLPMVFEPTASPEVVPAQFFRELIAPRITRLFSAFKNGGSAANWLHIAGQVNPILPLYPAMGVEIANFDYCVNPEDAISLLPATCLDGNIRPYAFVKGTEESIASEAASLLRRFQDRGGFILSSGCELPPESRPENIKAFVESVRMAC